MCQILVPWCEISDKPSIESAGQDGFDLMNRKQMMQLQLRVRLPAPEFAKGVYNQSMPGYRSGNSNSKRTRFAKTSAGTKNRAVPGRVGLYTIIARYGMKTKTLKGTTPSARGAHLYKGPAESRSGLGGSIVTMVQPADSLLGKNPT